MPESELAPSNQQISNAWIDQFSAFDKLELYQIALNNRHYRFQSMADMIQVLEALCIPLHYIEDENSCHEYLVEFIRCVFDSCIITTRELKLGYKNLLVVANKKQ